MDKDDEQTIVAYTDGSCYPNPDGIGGWAFNLTYQGKKAVRHGSRYNGKAKMLRGVTNNQMELVAILMVLRFVPLEPAAPLLIVTDSQYCLSATTKWVDGWVEGGWKTSTGQPVKNRELVEEIYDLLRLHRRNRELELIWVKGHSGVPRNEEVDRLANEGRTTGSTSWKPRRDWRTRIS